MNKKTVGLILIIVFVIISILLLSIKQFSLSMVVCLIYNCLVILGILMWNYSIPVSEMQRTAISAILWFWLFWYALFFSVKVLIT